MITETIDIKPLSVNAGFQGRRFKNAAHKAYEEEMLWRFPSHELIKGYVEVNYSFYLKNWKMRDVDNMVKILQDILVKKGYIEDDRKIMKFTAQKFPAKIESIKFEIKPFEGVDNLT
jgi:Holliday junction resolvase RusA-like endonuclease